MFLGNLSLTVGASTLSLGSVPIGTSLNAATYTVSGTCVAGQGDVRVSVGTVTDDVSCGGNPGSYEAILDISSVSANPMTVTALQNENSVSKISVNDRAGPTSAPTATAPTGPVDGASYDLSIVCSEAGEIVSITGSGLNPATQEHTCATNGADDFLLNIEQDANYSSPNNLIISSTDQYGNPASGTTTVNVPIDTVPQTVSITTAPSVTSSNAHNFRVEGTCSKEGLPVMVSAGTVGPVTANCTSSSWFVELDVTTLNGASISITADHSSATQALETVTNSFICPANFIAVPKLTDYTANSFCVMKYEAKNDGSGNPVSTEATTPWVNISQTEAFSACRTLNSEGNDGDINSDANENGTYALISNPEWMTIARNIELIDENWSGNAVGTGCLFKGNAGGDSLQDCAGLSAPYYGSNATEFGPNRDRDGAASLTLSNSEEIWDLSGNVSEWVDWDMTNTLATVSPAEKAYVSGDGAPVGLWRQFNALDTKIGVGDEMPPASWAPSGAYTADNVIGVYLAGINTSGGAALRGGHWGSEIGAGPFTLWLWAESSVKENHIGFRCVYRP